MDIPRFRALIEKWRRRGGPEGDPTHRELTLASVEVFLENEPPSIVLEGPPTNIHVERRRFGGTDLEPLYIYESYRFSDGAESYLARSFYHESESACFLCRFIGAEIGLLERDDFRSDVLSEAIRYLGALGKARLEYETPNGREPVPMEIVPESPLTGQGHS